MTLQELESFFDSQENSAKFSRPIKTKLDSNNEEGYNMKEEFKARLYQETIYSTCTEKNTLVALPTGLGKTAIAMMLASHRLKQHPNSKILVRAPTRPLINQHLETFKKYLEVEEDSMVVFTGMISPEKRQKLWQEKQIILSTPQGLENDLISSRIDLKDVSLLIVDEAHRAVGDYSYVFVAKQYEKTAAYPKILALTASPGSNMDVLKEVTSNLFIEDIEVRNNEDPDVKPYIKTVKQEFLKLVLPEDILTVKKILEDCYKSKLKDVKELGFLNSIQFVSKTEIIKLQARLHGMIARGQQSTELWKAMSVLAEAMKISHGQELVETQGIEPAFKYLNGIKEDAKKTKTKATINLANDFYFKTALVKLENLIDKKIEHPKVRAIKKIVSSELHKKPDAKIIVFSNFRDVGSKVKETIEDVKQVRPVLFVGQAKKGTTGMNQKKQIETLQQFREGNYNVLIATSVGEERLDIPSVDLVIFYEPVASAIRTIQRRGRTGRQDEGRMIALVTEGTRDEAYKWSEHHKEKRMYRNIDKMKKDLKLKKNETLDKYTYVEDDTIIYADSRERSSGVLKELKDMGLKLQLEKLDVGDYILSERCGVEFKTVSDFVDSIVDGRLLGQITELKKSYLRP